LGREKGHMRRSKQRNGTGKTENIKTDCFGETLGCTGKETWGKGVKKKPETGGNDGIGKTVEPQGGRVGGKCLVRVTKNYP